MTKLTPGEPFDVSTLPHSYTYNGTQYSFSFEGLVPEIQETAGFLMEQGVLREESSFGFAVVIDSFPDVDVEFDIDDPSTYIAFVGGWGPDKDKLIANAVRKLRFAIREETESLSVIHEPGAYQVDTPVGSVNADGTFTWGDFPWGGATTVPFGKYTNTFSCSVYQQDEDDLFSGYMGKRFGMAMHRADTAPSDD